LYLVIRRLGGGTSIEPKSQILRSGLHSLITDDKLFMVKVFHGTQHGYLRIENEDDKAKIIDELNCLVSLEEASSLLSGEIHDKTIRITLTQTRSKRYEQDAQSSIFPEKDRVARRLREIGKVVISLPSSPEERIVC
jgi:hypothetical protein